MLKITSAQNPKIKEALALFDRRERDQRQEFLIEGYRETKRALDAGAPIHTLFIAPELFLGCNEDALIHQAKAQKIEVIECGKNAFQKLSYRDRPDGILAVSRQKHLKLSHLKLGDQPFILVLEGIEKPGNLGTMLRSADAAGVDAVVVVDPTTDIFNPNVVRASVGTLFSMPVVQTTSEECLAFLQEKGIKIVATTPHTDHLYTSANFKMPLAIVMGTEQVGLTPFWLSKAQESVRIPMRGQADSLNVATAATLLLFEVVRQRDAT
jgi:rRNA methylases